MNSSSWKCVFCNSINANNVTTCSCGKSREDSQQKIKDAQKSTHPVPEQKVINKMVQKEADIIETQKRIYYEQSIIKIIAQYKKLLDAGAITQEEFDKKKQSLLHK